MGTQAHSHHTAQGAVSADTAFTQAVGPAPIPTRPRVTTKGVPHTRHCECEQCTKQRALDLTAQKKFTDARRHRPRAELGDRWRNTDRSEVSFQALTEQLHEKTHVYNIQIKDALLRKVDRFSLKRSYALMEQLYPDDYEAFVLAYPLDDDAKAPGDPEVTEETLAQRLLSLGRRTAIQQKVIASRLNVSEPTVTRRLERGRTHFRILYLGIAPTSAIVDILSAGMDEHEAQEAS